MTGPTKIPQSYWNNPHVHSYAVNCDDPVLDSDVPDFRWGDFHGYDGHYHRVDGHCHESP